MTDAVMEKLDKLGEHIVSLNTSVKAAQEKAEAASTKADGIDAIDMEAIKAATEASTKTAEEMQDLHNQIKAIESTSQVIEKMVSRMGKSSGDSPDPIEAQAKEETVAYLRRGKKMSDEVVEAVSRNMVSKACLGTSDEVKEAMVKDLMAGSDPDGGYFIRPERSATMLQRIFETSPMRNICAIDTTTSDVLEYLIDDDEGSSGGWVGEVDPRGNTDTPKIGKLSVPVHEQFAQPLATQKMLDDAGFDVEAWLSRKTTDIMGRTENAAFVVGDGSQKPKGFLSYPNWLNDTYTRFALERRASTADGAFTGDSVKLIQNDLIEDYQSGARWGIQRSAWGDIIILKDSNGRYLLNQFELSGLQARDEMVLLGKPVTFMHDMPAVAVDSLSLVYGNFNVGYTIVDRIGFRVIRDPFTQKPYIKYYTTKRVGGDVTNYQALKILQLSATL